MVKSVKQNKIRLWLESTSGTSAAAYALLASLISTMIVASMSSAGESVGAAFETIAAEMGDAPSAPVGQDSVAAAK